MLRNEKQKSSGLSTKELNQRLSNGFRQILRSDFEMRMRRNPSYSLRAYSKALGASYSHLARIFSGQRGLSYKKFLDFAKNAKLDQVHVGPLMDQIEFKKKTNENLNVITGRIGQRQLNAKCLRLLGIIKAMNGKLDPKELSLLLSQNDSELENELKILRDFGMIQYDIDGKLGIDSKHEKVHSNELKCDDQVDHEGIDEMLKIISNYMDQVQAKQKEDVQFYSNHGILIQKNGFLTGKQLKKLNDEYMKFLKRVSLIGYGQSSRRKSGNHSDKKSVYYWNFNIIPGWIQK